VIVLREWKRAVKLRPDVELDAFIIMPDHVHGIIRLRDANPDSPGHRKSSSVPGLIQQLKSVTTRLINRWRGTPGARVWQRSYHDWVIRSEGSLSRIRAYIRNNPAKWELKGRPVRLSI
jgi:REP element-mobilizing transposase RayT